MNITDKYAFVGVGLINKGKLPGLTEQELATQAALMAIEDAGLKKSDINGFICQQSSGTAYCADIVRDTGISARLIWELAASALTESVFLSLQ